MASITPVLPPPATAQAEFDAAADDRYEPYFCDRIILMAEELMFPEEWAAELGVTEADLYDWIARFPEFARAWNIAATKLRAAFTRELRDQAKRPSSMSNPALLGLIAKTRFRDLYGGVDEGPAQPRDGRARFAPRDVTPGHAGAIEDMDAEEIMRELEQLRDRQG